MMIDSVSAADAAIKRLGDENQGLFDGLMQLENHTGRKLLDGGVLQGITLGRWQTTREGYAVLWTLYDLHRDALDAVREIRERRGWRSPYDLDDIEHLLTGADAVTVPKLPGCRAGRMSVTDLVAEILAVGGEIREVVTAVDRVWGELSPVINRCEEILTVATAAGTELGLPPDADPSAALHFRLADLREVALTDPLSRWTGSAVDRSEADGLVAACEQAGAELVALDDVRRGAAARLDQVGAVLAEIDELARQVVLARAEVAIKIAEVPPAAAEAGVAAAVRTGLADARELCATSRWREVAAEVGALEARSQAAHAAAVAAVDAGRQPLRVRAELRSRLDLYRAKAAGRGRSEDLDLERAYRAVHDLLWSAPCDLVVAAAAVQDYQHRINRTPTDLVAGGEST